MIGDILSKLRAFFSEPPDQEGSLSFSQRTKESKDKFIELVKRLDKQTKAIYMGIAIAVFLLTPWLVGFFTMISLALEGRYSFAFASSQSPLQYIIIGIFPGLGLGSTLFVYLLGACLIMLTIIIRSPDLSQIAETDERGVSYAVNATYGSARWMSKKEAAQVYCVGDIKDATGYILGQFTTEGKECISLPITSGGNQNFLVIGSPGRGKTFSFGFNAIFQAIVRGESVVCVDPKGELCEKSYNLFKQRGYDVKVYNMVHPEKSNAWNFAEEIFDVNTGRMDFSRLTAFVDIVMTNTVDGEKEDGFWGPGEHNLFQAAVAYNGWKYEQTYEENLNRSADQWEEQDLPLITREERDKLFAIIRNKGKNLREKESALRLIMKSSNIVSDEEIDVYISELKEASDPVTIDKIFGMFVRYDLAELMKMFNDAQIPTSHPASIAWSMFKHSDAKIQPNFIQGLSQRLKLFANTDIVSMSAHTDINFRSLGDRKTVIFCVISDKDSSRKLLTSLFFSFLFRDVSDAADELGANNRIPVNVMCDEFANIGHIPDFDRVISTVRSRKIYLTIIIQSVEQLAKAYDEHDQGTIIECCDTVIFLGCNGDANAEFISNLSGGATVITNSIRDAKNVSGMRGLAQGYATSEGAGKRPLITPDEAKRLDIEEILIYHAGQQMLRAKRCGYIYHPFYKAGLPEPAPLAKFPTTEEFYGPYHSIFEDYSDGDLQQQKVWNTINSRIMSTQPSGRAAKGQSKAVEPEEQDAPAMARDSAKGPMEGLKNTEKAERQEPAKRRPEPPTGKGHTQTYARRPSPYASSTTTEGATTASSQGAKPAKKKAKTKPIRDKTSQNSLTGISDTFNTNI